MRLGSTVASIVLSAVAVACLAVAVACSAAGAFSQPAGEGLTIYAAASLRGAMDDVRTAYESVHPGLMLTVATDSSATLRTQIEEGAPADVFLSADESNPTRLVDEGLVDGEPVAFASNELTIVVPSGNPAGVDGPADLARPGVRIVAAGDEVPITKYAAQLVANLADQPGYPTAFAEAYAANVVSKEDNVRALIAKVELGEGDAGIVYVTDARASSKVDTINVPDTANVPATYAGVVVKASSNRSAAQAFLGWLSGPDGRALLAGFGFLAPP